ncbi:MAG: MogA/MoaB family molybdenum cofactor biosynthesis protein [Thermoplasmatales archaeon]|nr:MogA/MoaB family molybdenum cofactor biosynthesis protein [Thermoplasmatales archaeon]
MGYKEHKCHSLKNVNVAVITVSDSRTKENDESGKYIMKKLEENGHKIISYSIIRDEKKLLRDELEKLVNNDDVQVIITNGGTGASRRDVTVDVVENMFDKKLDGFGEIFRYLSYKEIGSPAVMSRAVAGAVKNKIIICLPGSLGAVKLGVEKLVIPEIGHLVWEVNR